MRGGRRDGQELNETEFVKWLKSKSYLGQMCSLLQDSQSLCQRKPASSLFCRANILKPKSRTKKVVTRVQ